MLAYALARNILQSNRWRGPQFREMLESGFPAEKYQNGRERVKECANGESSPDLVK